MVMPAAVWAGLTARKLYTIERRREDDRDVAEESRQTELVASWVSWTDQPRIAMHLPDGRTSRANLAIQNGSAVPVYDVQVMYIEGREPLGNAAVSCPFADWVRRALSPDQVRRRYRGSCATARR